MKGGDVPGETLSAPWTWCLVFALPFLMVFALTRFNYPLHGDEVSFYPITLQFGTHLLPSIQLLRSYEQLQTPLMFWVFGLVGYVAGFDLWKMRAGVALLSYLTLLLFFRLCRTRYAGLKPWLPIYATCALALSPYYAGASLYYYTDIPCLFAMMLALNFYLSGRPIAGAVAAGVALLIRQFSVFLPAAYVLTSVTKPRAAWRDLRHGVPLVLPFVMFLPLAVLWRGISPQNHLHELIRQVGFFHLEFVNYLVIATGVYSLPLAILRTREILQPHRLLVAALLTPLLLTALPRPNPEILDLPVKTLGYLDIALTSAFGDHKTFPYLVLWVLGCLTLLEVLHIERHEPEKLILFAIAGFFVMHLFAHMVWDKYVLLILPMVFLSLGRGRTRSMRPACAVREA